MATEKCESRRAIAPRRLLLVLTLGTATRALALRMSSKQCGGNRGFASTLTAIATCRGGPPWQPLVLISIQGGHRTTPTGLAKLLLQPTSIINLHTQATRISTLWRRFICVPGQYSFATVEGKYVQTEYVQTE